MRRRIRRHIRRHADGVDLALDVNAVAAVKSGGSETQAVQSTSIVQGAAVGAHAGDGERTHDEQDDSPQEER